MKRNNRTYRHALIENLFPSFVGYWIFYVQLFQSKWVEETAGKNFQLITRGVVTVTSRVMAITSGVIRITLEVKGINVKN